MSGGTKLDTQATFGRSASVLVQATVHPERADARILGRHLLGMALCLAHWPPDDPPEERAVLRDNRRRVAQQLLILAFEAAQLRTRERLRDFAQRVNVLVIDIVTAQEKNLRCFAPVAPKPARGPMYTTRSRTLTRLGVSVHAWPG